MYVKKILQNNCRVMQFYCYSESMSDWKSELNGQFPRVPEAPTPCWLSNYGFMQAEMGCSWEHARI